ncbi:MAG: hypothetical protein JJU29_13805 [Verrucomicrobia bacterium]|nr:hypothetical protein [Verrucomicrobiota bacterium]MCH8513775.1 hypothetical protein [Kiritimatiellia bacterium]
MKRNHDINYIVENNTLVSTMLSDKANYHATISYYSGTAGTPTFVAKYPINERYVVSLKFEVDLKSDKIEQSSEATLSIMEVVSIFKKPDGRMMSERKMVLLEMIIEYDGENSVQKLEKLIDSLTTNSTPVNNFDAYWLRERGL